jgi:hypothetical protein
MTLTTPPDLQNSTTVLVIDESVRRKLGKLHILELIKKLTNPEMNCYVDIIPTGTSDDGIIKVFNSYVDIGYVENIINIARLVNLCML